MDRAVCIEKKLFRAVKEEHHNCLDCDIFKQAPPDDPHRYPLCYQYNMMGKRTESTRGLIVNWCARHPSYIWKRD